MKNTEFKINTTKRNIIIALVVIMVAAMAGIFVGCKAHNATNNTTSEVVEESTTPAPTEEPTSTPEATVEPTSTPEVSEEPTSTPEATEEPTPNPTEAPEATEEPTEAPETPAPTEEPKPTEEPTPTPEPTEPPHTHNYSTKVTPPTCTTQGYTTYTCNCGHSYKDNYTTGSHNYSNGTCTACGAADPNWVPPHTHSWTEHTWTEDVVDGHMVEVYVCGCGIEWATIDECMAHQMATPQCGGWCNNNKWVETITQIIHHYRECACGAREDID